MKAFLDTHAAVGLAEGATDFFGPRAADLLERAALFVSPVVRLELQYLHEIGRIVEPTRIIGHLEERYGVTLTDDRITEVVAESLDLTWTRDPFDRLIVATARLHRAPLLTRDELILEHYSDAVW